VSLLTFKKVIIYLISGIMFYQLTSCNTFQPDTSVPAYLSVDSVVFTDNPVTQGYPTSNITNVWAYYNNNPIGVYDVPALFPILTRGNTFIQLSPGIENNGLQETRVIYPFYTFVTDTVNFQVGHISSLIPHFTYRSNTKFPWITDFETGNNFHTFDGSDTTLFRLSGSPYVKYGKYCGCACLDVNHPFFQVESVQADSLPNDGTGVYVEMDYMCTIPFSIGIVDIQDGDTVFNNDSPVNYFEQINPSGTWNKIYIDLETYLAISNSNVYQIAFAANLPQGYTSGQIYLDNIKLVHF